MDYVKYYKSYNKDNYAAVEETRKGHILTITVDGAATVTSINGSLGHTERS